MPHRHHEERALTRVLVCGCVALVWLLPLGCGDQRTARGKDPELVAVADVSLLLAADGVQIQTQAQTVCLVAETGIGAEATRRCQLLRLGDQERAAVFAMVRQTRTMPPLVAFELLDEDPDSAGKYEALTLFFRAADRCAAAEAAAREAGFATRRCAPYEPTAG